MRASAHAAEMDHHQTPCLPGAGTPCPACLGRHALLSAPGGPPAMSRQRGYDQIQRYFMIANRQQ
jgi:hypothetical protein